MRASSNSFLRHRNQITDGDAGNVVAFSPERMEPWSVARHRWFDESVRRRSRQLLLVNAKVRCVWSCWYRIMAYALETETEPLVTSGGGSAIQLWRGNQQREILRGHVSLVRALAWAPDGSLLASASYDNTIRLWRRGVNTTAAKASPEKEDRHHPQSYGSRKRTPEKETEEASWVTTAILSGHTREVLSVALSKKGLLVSGSWDGTIRVWSVDRAERGDPGCIHKFTHGQAIRAAAFAPSGDIFATGHDDAKVRIRHIEDWDSDPRILNGHTHWIYGVAFAHGRPDGELVVASCAQDGKVHVWAGRRCGIREINWISLAVLRRHSGWVYSVAFSHDGTILASTGTDAKIVLHRLSYSLNKTTTIDHLATIQKAHDGIVYSVAFPTSIKAATPPAPYGYTLASSAVDGTVAIWDIPNPGHPRPQAPTAASDFSSSSS